MTRLSTASLAALPKAVARPGYDRENVAVGVVHLGIGAFHRAHQAVVFDRALEAGDARWGIVGVSLRSPDMRDRMALQDGLYTLIEREGETRRMRVIGAVRDVIVAPADPERVIDLLAAAETAIVTLTVTEMGYKLDPASGRLIADDPDVAADIADLSRPRTAPGFLVAGLARRLAAGLAPFTAISCDNLPHNGVHLRDAVLAMAVVHDPGLAAWIAQRGAFPQTMVDRIVPATDDADIATFGAETGIEDRALVKTEPFLQWVIEDRFCGPRPAFETLGVEIAGDVRPWEEAKLRLLDGARSTIAYLGGLAGIEFVHEFVAWAEGRALVDALWDEAAATLSLPPGMDVMAYRRDLLARFMNSALRHRARRIAMDGSQKLPQRLLAPIADRAAACLVSPVLTLGVAAWMHWQGGRDDLGRTFTVEDPMAERLQAAWRSGGNVAEKIDALLAIEAIFPRTLAGNAEFRAALGNEFDLLAREGSFVAIRRALAETRRPFLR